MAGYTPLTPLERMGFGSVAEYDVFSQRELPGDKYADAVLEDVPFFDPIGHLELESIACKRALHPTEGFRVDMPIEDLDDL